MFLQGKVDDHRRKWDAEEYEQLARERVEEEEGLWEAASSSSKRKDAVPKRDLLKPRSYKV